MNKTAYFFLLVSSIAAAQSSTDILEQSIRYHDPENKWSTLEATFYYTETRPDGPDRKATFLLNNAKGGWTVNRNDQEVYEIVGDKATVLSGDKEASRGVMLRNYYLYLWGLPMKLKDQSTPEITRVDDDQVNNIPVHVLRVAYEKETYYFAMDQTTGRMLEYRFYKDEGAGKGELIKLEEEVAFNGFRIPKKRSWYTLPEMKYLGTDILDRIE